MNFSSTSDVSTRYERYTEDLWAKEVNSISQLGNATWTMLKECGVHNPVHAADIIAQSKAPGKWSFVSYIVRLANCCANFMCTAIGLCAY